MKIPKRVKIRLGPARRVYVARLLERGLHGDTPEEVVDVIFCRGLQECVPSEWMLEAVQRGAFRRKKAAGASHTSG